MLSEILPQIEISNQLTLVVPALMIIGYALKRTPQVADWLIIWILLLIGIVASGLTLGFTVSGIANGIIAAGAAITSHQAYKQTMIRGRLVPKKQLGDRNREKK
ncbi:hypothetical protein DS745_17760 [Anaerobacillus alkaliphilus]|uniref:Holin n=1 Tax=Anaerobacillus alkaliphilus TaxID=1548597 RepID=A0A4Q0VP31_9BACI|nr:phage holin family protein [Anaerobacillus alkaliphilus]RXI98186.1 hypothetical protein DS745_17760 [Anaerobacillus alkaliphilus]